MTSDLDGNTITGQEKGTKSSQKEEESTGSKMTVGDGSLREKDDSSSSKHERNQEAKDVRSHEGKDVRSQKVDDVKSQEAKHVTVDVTNQEAKEVKSQEAEDPVSVSGKVESNNPNQQREQEKTSHEEEEGESQEAEDPVSMSEKMESHSTSNPPDKHKEQVKTSHEEVEEGESQEAESMNSEELSDGSCDMNAAMITLCTPESQLTPPDDTSDTIDQHEHDTDTSEKAQEEITVGEEMDVDNNHFKTAHLESPPPTPPTAEPDLQPQALSISHDHSYCSQTPDNNSFALSAPLDRDEKINKGALPAMVLDHTYCSQMGAVGESADHAKTKAKTGDTALCDAQRATGSGESRDRENNIGSKLSLTVHDHTYCSNSWPEPEEERNDEPCLMEMPKHQQEKDGLAALTEEGRKETDRETGPTAMDEGGVVMDDKEQSDVTREERGMETELVHETALAQVDLDMSGDSDVFTDGEEEEGEGENESISSSSQSQELFSQQPSQEEQQLAVERGDTSVGAKSSSILPNSREGIGDQGVNGDESADVAVAQGDGNEGETDRGNRDGKQEQEVREVMAGDQSAVLVAAAIKGQEPPTAGVGSGGSADSSDSSSTHTYNAECSQRPSSFPSDSTHEPTLNQSASSSPHSIDPTKSEKGSSSNFLAILSQVRELYKKLDQLLEEKDSLSQTESLACLQTLDIVTQTAGKFSKALMQNTRAQSSHDTAL